MNEPHSHLLDGSPRLHYLEWNPRGTRTIILMHGNTANAWWWEPMARVIAPEYRLLALDQRGHGDSEWVRPRAYSPADYAGDIARFVAHVAPKGEKPVVVGHSMGGLSRAIIRKVRAARWRSTSPSPPAGGGTDICVG